MPTPPALRPRRNKRVILQSANTVSALAPDSGSRPGSGFGTDVSKNVVALRPAMALSAGQNGKSTAVFRLVD